MVLGAATVKGRLLFKCGYKLRFYGIFTILAAGEYTLNVITSHLFFVKLLNAKIFEKSLFLVEILPSKPLKSCSSHFGKYLSLAIGKSQIRVISTSFSLWIFTSTLLAVLTRLKLQY